MYKSTFVVSVMVFLGSVIAQGSSIVVDQSSFVWGTPLPRDAGVNNFPEPNGDNQAAQTFTVANTGILTQIDVVLNAQIPLLWTGDLFFDVRPLINGVPVEDDALALVSRRISNVPGCVLLCGTDIVSFANLAISVTRGDVLAIVLRGAPPNGSSVWYGGQYAAGMTFQRSIVPGGVWVTGGLPPLAFQTFVDCANPNSCIPDGGPGNPNVTKQLVLDQITAATQYTSGATTDDSTKLQAAIQLLADSLEPLLWNGNSRLSADLGAAVFQNEKAAVQKLTQVMKNIGPSFAAAALQGWIDTLVGADKALAQTAIGDAAAGHRKELNEAAKEMARAADATFSGNAAKALEHYKNAWSEAQEAVK